MGGDLVAQRGSLRVVHDDPDHELQLACRTIDRRAAAIDGFVVWGSDPFALRERLLALAGRIQAADLWPDLRVR